jgi:hypothetical protein
MASVYKRGKSRPDVGFALRGPKGLSKYGRQYNVVGVLTARWVHARRRPFDVNDVKLRRLPTDLAPNLVRSWIGEYLTAWENPTLSGNSFLASALVKRNPQLTDRVKMYWKGW